MMFSIFNLDFYLEPIFSALHYHFFMIHFQFSSFQSPDELLKDWKIFPTDFSPNI